MNLKPGGKQARLCDTVIPVDDPHIPEERRGQRQSMCFPINYHIPLLAGQPKGIEQVLSEQGIWQHYSCVRFASQLPILQLKCKECTASAAAKEAEVRAANLAKQAENKGYFVDQEQCVREILGSTNTQTEPPSKVKDCCWLQIMASQLDFQAKQPLLQTIVEEAGHICLLLPKFHCELNPIELLWAYVKSGRLVFVLIDFMSC
jgi:hypothetical protein